MVIYAIGDEIKNCGLGSHKAVRMKMQRVRIAETQPYATVLQPDFVDVDHIRFIDIYGVESSEPVEYRYIASDFRVRRRSTPVRHNPVARRRPAAAIGVVPIVERLVCKKSRTCNNGRCSNCHTYGKGSRTGHCLFHIFTSANVPT